MEELIKILRENGVIDKIKSTVMKTDKVMRETVPAEINLDRARHNSIKLVISFETSKSDAVFSALFDYAIDEAAKAVYAEIQKEASDE